MTVALKTKAPLFNAQGYVAGEPVYHYPAAGDPLPPGGAKCLLLTVGGICVIGSWSGPGLLAWAPLPKRNKIKEQLCK